MRTLPERFFAQSLLHGNRTLFAARHADTWSMQTWAEAANRVAQAMQALRLAGIGPGDRVVLLAENRPEWAILDLAIMAVGALVVPAYVTHTAADLGHILKLTTPRAAVVSTAALTNRLLAAHPEADSLEIIWSEDAEAVTHPESQVILHPWTALWVANPTQSAACHPAHPDDPCCLIFTSGTGGQPKAAILTHRSIGSNVDAAATILRNHGFGPHDRFLSFLPLAHAYEHTAGLHLPITLGAEVWYCESTERLQQYLGEVRPTLATAVPRLYDLLYARILSQVKQARGLKSWLFHQAVTIGHKRIDGSPLHIGERLLDPILDRLIRARVRARFGGRIQFFISGGAPLNPAVGRFFTSLGIGILQGYGQTEASPLISVNTPDAVKLHTVGRPFANVEIRLADDGELLVRGDMVMAGYWQDPIATAAALRDGWLHTGDLATIDADGFIEIIGRKKDLIITSGGDNIAPAKLEAALTLHDEIEQAVVIGDGRPWLAAIIVPSQLLLDAELSPDGIQAAIDLAVRRVNESLSPPEKIRRFMVHESLFSTENGLLTPTHKVRRSLVLAALQPEIEQLYAGR